MWYSARLIHQASINKKLSHFCDITLILLKAKTVEMAYKKAFDFAKEKESICKNENNEIVRWKFIGFIDLQKIENIKISDGTEVYYDFCELSQKEVKKLVRPKQKLLIFND